MTATFLKGVVLGTVVSCSIVMATSAFAGTGVGAVFNLGKYNGVNSTSALAGATPGKQLNVTNISNAAGAAGIGISVHSGKPPLVVNSATKVANLNADELDGLDSSKLQRRVNWAVVNGNGTLARGSTGATSSHLGTGLYQVDLGHDVTGCAYIATIGSATNAGVAAGFITVAERGGNAHALFVTTFDTSISSADRGFHVEVTC